MKKLLLIFSFLLLFSIGAYAFNIGDEAIDRPSTYNATYTLINKEVIASTAGTIIYVEIWADTTLYDCEVAIFSEAMGMFGTTDSEAIGTVTAGSKQVFSVNLTAAQYNMIGIYYTSGSIKRTTSGEGGVYYLAGDQIPCEYAVFSEAAGEAISLLGSTTFITPPQVTGVSATDGTHTDKVVITWNIAQGATKYYVWTGADWIDVGNVLTYDDTEAPAPTITPGTASASDGTSADYVTLSIAGESVNNGASIDYKVKAWNPGGYGTDSAVNAGYRGVGALTYQWQRSAADSDADYSNIDGATTDPYNDTGAPADGSGRYYKCVENATGAAEQTTNADRGYRIAAGITWNGIVITKWNGVTITIPLNTQ